RPRQERHGPDAGHGLHDQAGALPEEGRPGRPRRRRSQRRRGRHSLRLPLRQERQARETHGHSRPHLRRDEGKPLRAGGRGRGNAATALRKEGRRRRWQEGGAMRKRVILSLLLLAATPAWYSAGGPDKKPPPPSEVGPKPKAVAPVAPEDVEKSIAR